MPFKASIVWLMTCLCCYGYDEPAVSFGKVPRTVSKQPQYEGKPGYLLLIFGHDVKQGRWLAIDDKRAYFDRRGDGDLTRPENRLEPDKEYSDQDLQYYNLGELSAGNLKHHNVKIAVTNIAQLKDRADAPEQTGLNPKTKCVSIWGEFEVPGFSGRCAYGRVPRSAGFYDQDGYLALSDDPKSARIVHFGHKWTVQLDGQQKFFQGTEKDILLSVGSRGLGPGTFAKLGYEKVIPADVQPRIKILFPQAQGAGLHEHEEILKERC